MDDRGFSREDGRMFGVGEPDSTGSPMIPPPDVKICGLTRRGDAEMAVDEGASYLGIVLVPGTPRALSASEGRKVVSELDVPVVAVMADPSIEEAVASANGLRASVIQLHGDEDPRLIRTLREEGPWNIWKALRVKDVGTLAGEIARFSPFVDGILLDSWHPRRRGGTGKRFSWADAEAVRSEFPLELRLIAAGGLNPDNVQEAVRRLTPHVVDVSSGVEDTPGIKSRERVAAFIRAVAGTGLERKAADE